MLRNSSPKQLRDNQNKTTEVNIWTETMTLKCESEVEDSGDAEAEQVESSDEAEEMNSEERVSADEEDERDPELQPALTRKYPLRHRQPPKRLTYKTLGQPLVTCRDE